MARYLMMRHLAQIHIGNVGMMKIMTFSWMYVLVFDNQSFSIDQVEFHKMITRIHDFIFFQEIKY